LRGGICVEMIVISDCSCVFIEFVYGGAWCADMACGDDGGVGVWRGVTNKLPLGGKLVSV
jgi:hypothetical protein